MNDSNPTSPSAADTSGPPTTAPSAVDLRERQVEIREEEVSLRERLADLREKDSQRSRWRDPLFLAIVAAVVGLVGNLTVTFIQGRENIAAEKLKGQSDLILQAIKTNESDSARNLAFFVKLGLLDDPNHNIEKFIAAQGAPSLPGGGPSAPSRASSRRASLKYREPNLSETPQPVTVDELFNWPRVAISEPQAMSSEGPVDERENKVLQITGDIYAVQEDGVSGTLRLMIASPGRGDAPDHLIIVAVPDPNVGGGELIQDKQPYAQARSSLLGFSGVQEQDLDKLLWDYTPSKRTRITATGYAFYNPSYLHYPMEGHPGKIGAWQLSPVWNIVSAQ
jgi:hypothetical protein